VTYFNAALLGILQGLTEFLPVSSTAHLVIAGDALGYDDPGGAFKVMIQLGSILAVMWLYRDKIIRVLAGLTSDPQARHFAAMLVLAFVPAAVLGLLFKDFVTSVLYESPRVIATAFVVGGIVMLLVERMRPVPDVFDAERTPLGRAFGIGVCQALALIPGVSRSGATIVGGMILRLDRAAAAEFSFFLSMPIMAAAFGLSLLDVKDHLSAERGVEIAIGFVMAFVASAVVIKPFLGFVRRAGFGPFAWYRIAAGLVLFGALSAGWI
jgi:undecaprenyl-diphosphatase